VNRSIATVQYSIERWSRCASMPSRGDPDSAANRRRRRSAAWSICLEKALLQTDQREFTESEVPADMATIVSARDALIEMVAENDEKLMEKFLKPAR
jgi:translation elongation factor EF-G